MRIPNLFTQNFPYQKRVTFTHFVYGKFWVISQWEHANVHQYREGGSAYGLIFGIKYGLLSSENGYLGEVILDISE